MCIFVSANPKHSTNEDMVLNTRLQHGGLVEETLIIDEGVSHRLCEHSHRLNVSVI